jgi:hypothetical protein
MLARRIGRDRARALAECESLDAALAELSGSAYGRSVRPGMDLARAQRAIAEAALWHVRVLAGWVPPGAMEAVRSLAGWFELVNIEDHFAYLGGADVPTPFVLGGLATAWGRVADTRTVTEARAALAASAWGDPGDDDSHDVRGALRLAWARRIVDSVVDAGDWAAGAVALAIARELFLAGRSAEELAARRPPGVGDAWKRAASLRELREALPSQAAWALASVDAPAELWRAEAGWWRRVEDDAEALVHAPLMGVPWVMGSVALLGVDAWRAAGALESAVRGGGREAVEVFDDIA